LGRVDPDRVSVIGRTSMFAYRGGGRLRFTSRLIRAADQVQLWSDSIARERGSTLGVQQELSRHIAPPAGDCCPRRWSRVRDRLS
jgi:hypothetical protein